MGVRDPFDPKARTPLKCVEGSRGRQPKSRPRRLPARSSSPLYFFLDSPDGWLVVDLPASDEPILKKLSIRKRRASRTSGVDVYKSRLLRVSVRGSRTVELHMCFYLVNLIPHLHARELAYNYIICT